jgi:glycosyltransferase involved in cell wall biosynthesis
MRGAARAFEAPSTDASEPKQDSSVDTSRIETQQLPMTKEEEASHDFVLATVSVAKGCFLVARVRAEDQSSFATGTPDDPAPIFLSDWGAADCGSDLTRLSALRGATLFFLDTNAALQFDYANYVKLARLGILRTIWHNPYRMGEVHGLRLSAPSYIRRVLSLLSLMPRRLVALGNRSWMRQALDAQSFSQSPDGYLSDHRIESIEKNNDRDLFSDYMVFEGSRQLPPVHSSHSDIAEKGGGRYSIWNQASHFSPTAAARLQRFPYIVVRRTSDIEPCLQMIPEVHAATSVGPELIEFSARYIERRENSVGSLQLAPGDRIAVSTHGLPPGGAQRQWVYLAKALARKGYAVTFVVDDLAGENAHYAPMLARTGVPIVTAKDTLPLDQIRGWPRTRAAFALLECGLIPEPAKLVRLTAAIRSIAPRTIFAQLDETNLLSGFAGLLADTQRIVLSFRNYNPTNFSYLSSAWHLPAYRLLARSGSVRFSGNSQAGSHDYADWIGIARDRIALVPNVIDPEEFPLPNTAESDALRAALGVTETTPVLLGVFRLSEEKDPLAFVDVCRLVADQLPQLRAFLVGGGPMRNSVEQRITEQGLIQNLTLLGERSDINVLLKVANVLLLTSVLEGMPNIVMEAQFLGTPVVATDAGGTPDTLLRGQSALLRSVGDRRGLANDCILLLRNRERARCMGETGRRYATTEFSLDRLVNRYLSVATN